MTVEPYHPVIGFDQPLAAFMGGPTRHLNRRLAEIETDTSVRVARINAAAEVQAAKLDALTFVTRKAIQDAVLLGRVLAETTAAVPDAADLLAAIVERAAAAMNDVVTDAGRQMGR